MSKKIILIGIAILAIAAVTYTAWYSYDRHEELVQAERCNDMLANPPKPTMVTGPDGNPAPLYSLNGCTTVVVPPSLWNILRGRMVFENVPNGMKVNPYTFTDILLGRYTFGPTDIGCDQSATSTDCVALIAKKQAMAGPTITPGADKVPQPPTLGIQDPIDQDIVGKEMVLGTNSWWGYVDGKLTTVTGTAYRNNPSQGALFVWEPGTPTSSIESSRTYLAPTATGPLKIVSEANGVLTVQSLAGTYEAYDENTNTRWNVTTPGGTTYTFDVASRTLR